jgi:hypothetical protein
MASLLDGFKNAIIEALRPGTREALGEREVLRQMYSAENAGRIQPNAWYRLHNQNGDCVGFSFVCNCNVERQMLSAFEWMRDYSCPQCGAKFDLLRSVGIKAANGEFTKKPEEWEKLLATLPIRPRMQGKPTPKAVDTWESSGSGEVEWTGSKPYSVEGWN